MSSIEEKLDQAKQLSAAGDETKAQELLLEVLREEPHSSAGLYMLGGSYYCEKRYAESKVIFEQLVLMFPGEGKASTGLYNSLWNQGLATEALEEIKRFLQNADSKAERETIESYLRFIETLSADESQNPN